MIEVNEQFILKDLDEKKNKVRIIYCYTPLCGTCLLASQLLEKWEMETSTISIHKLNLNMNRQIASLWKIKSVPYVIVFVDGVKVHDFYAFYSYEHIKRQLNVFLSLQ